MKREETKPVATEEVTTEEGGPVTRPTKPPVVK